MVAILTLDTRNNHNSGGKTFSSIQSKSNCEAKAQDKELLASRLSDSLKDHQETDRDEICDSADTKSRRLRRETKRTRVTSCSLDGEDVSDNTSDEESLQKKLRSSQLSPSPSSSAVPATRSEKLRSGALS